MTSKHTPGPWTFDGGVRVNDANRVAVAKVYNADATGQADARLIAAAPEMLEVLRELSAYYYGKRTDVQELALIAGTADALLARLDGGK